MYTTAINASNASEIIEVLFLPPDFFSPSPNIILELYEKSIIKFEKAIELKADNYFAINNLAISLNVSFLTK